MVHVSHAGPEPETDVTVPPPPLPQVPPLSTKFPLASDLIQFPDVKAPVTVANSVVLPERVPTAVAWPPAPITRRFAVSAEAFVVQVAHAIVPVVVMVPPVIGEVVATDVTVPEPPPPGGAAQLPSARRKFVVPPPEAGASP